jgi:hypothetical protein
MDAAIALMPQVISMELLRYIIWTYLEQFSMLQINMNWGCFISFTAWSFMEENYTFAAMVHLVLVLHHGFDSSRRKFITL